MRAGFLRETGLRFPTGRYEYIPFTYPLLARARRISVLPRVCISYRRRRHGNILGTTSAQHTQVFDQYELALSRIEDPLVRQHVARAAVDHGSTILGIRERLPANVRKAFLKRSKDFGLRYRRIRPAIRDLLISRGAPGAPTGSSSAPAWPASRNPTPLDDSPSSLARLLLVPAPISLAGLGRLQQLLGPGLRIQSGRDPRRRSPLAPHVRSVWAVTADQKHRLPPGVEAAVTHSFAYYRALARAKWTFDNANFRDEVVKRPGSVHVQTHHGTPLKLTGVDEPPFATTPIGS
ncbi:CDP-glycerol glycerophosphotransferase family protein [Allorhizocola rhizosphaerae]|uniref:CDP-glycerol glycerophosphotransferase family protein n=1 Tax=Allorhizocola rhizosphaerae TaxID=1872709 RepID=UPI0013C311DF|nr:CDP-glycerol glycerophosphotransferase family protein [Allorhizocola rhizosphaerae]